MAGQQSLNLSGQSTSVLEGCFAVSTQTTFGLLNLLCMIAFAYCVIKIFFANIKRGGILLIQMVVGSLYMFSVPRGYTDGFNQWMKQIAALVLQPLCRRLVVPRFAHISRQYVVGVRHYAVGKRSTENCTAVWS